MIRRFGPLQKNTRPIPSLPFLGSVLHRNHNDSAGCHAFAAEETGKCHAAGRPRKHDPPGRHAFAAARRRNRAARKGRESMAPGVRLLSQPRKLLDHCSEVVRVACRATGLTVRFEHAVERRQAVPARLNRRKWIDQLVGLVWPDHPYVVLVKPAVLHEGLGDDQNGVRLRPVFSLLR